MKMVVFTGPTLSADDARAAIDAVVLPPAAQGDVYRVTSRERPAAIGLIDGYFDTLPAVWHKELLWALREGVAVFGSASMGALRAAELAAFGMRGVGSVFEDFASGRLEDDDEVALAHESAERGYRAMSVPMVNVRATLAAAESAGVVSPATRERLVERMKALFYPDRTYPRLLAEGRAADVVASELDALSTWLASGKVDVKRADALAMLRVMRDAPAPGEPPRFHFEHTTYWDALRAQEDAEADGPR